MKKTIVNLSHSTNLFLRLGLFNDGNKRVDLVQRHLLGGVASLHQLHTFYMLQRLNISADRTHRGK